ncbi:MAG: oxaloacetate decarboxylase [Oscillospiraceae bacterium]
MQLNFDAFLTTLPMMAEGMGGILLVTLVMMGVIVLLNRIFKEKK